MDNADRASERESEILADAMGDIARKPKMQFTGFCHNCDAEITRGNFCDADCRDDFERRQKLKARKGA